MTTAFSLSLKPLPPPLSFPSAPANPHLTLTNPKTHRTPQSKIPKIPFSSFRYDSGTPPETRCPVPPDQQPINEYQALSDSFLFSWATGDVAGYSSKLLATGACFALFVGLPVSWAGSVGPEAQPTRLLLGAASSGLFVVVLAVVRMYLGWAYVGNRLLSATVEYEETGWYDGRVWVKSPEVLARDRLLGSFSVKPVLARLKNTLVVLGASLLMCVSILVNSESSHSSGYTVTSQEPGGRAVVGIYKDESARNFEPDAFCGDSK